jgi:hypothetical protein
MEEGIQCHHSLLIPDKENLRQNLKSKARIFVE